jgi:hypothetical protein
MLEINWLQNLVRRWVLPPARDGVALSDSHTHRQLPAGSIEQDGTVGYPPHVGCEEMAL